MNYNIENNIFELHGNTIVSYSKEKNGDYISVANLENENTLLAIASDGISSRPCDWMASELTCKTFIESFIRYKDLSPYSERIRKSIIETNRKILSVNGDCLDLASTLILVVWPYINSQYYCVSIGDSRIYRIQENSFLCLTYDDSHIKSNPDESKTKRISNYIGKPIINASIIERDFDKSEILLLCTDGFYEARKSSFEYRLMELWKSSDLKNDFNNLFEKFQITAMDDMSAIVIRNNNCHKSE